MVEVSKAAHFGNSDALPKVDQSRLDVTHALFDLPFDELAERAGVVSNRRASCLKQPRIGASPINAHTSHYWGIAHRWGARHGWCGFSGDVSVWCRGLV